MKTMASRPRLMEFMENKHMILARSRMRTLNSGINCQFVPQNCVHYLLGLAKMFHWGFESKTWQQ